MEYTAKQESYLKAAIAKHGEGAILSKEALAEVAEENEMGFPFWMVDARRFGSITKVDKDSYRLPAYKWWRRGIGCRCGCNSSSR